MSQAFLHSLKNHRNVMLLIDMLLELFRLQIMNFVGSGTDKGWFFYLSSIQNAKLTGGPSYRIERQGKDCLYFQS
jgi:hypothetical protein